MLNIFIRFAENNNLMVFNNMKDFKNFKSESIIASDDKAHYQNLRAI